MPGVTLEDPFPVAKFHKALALEAVKRQSIVGLAPLEGAADNAEEHADRVVVTVQGEGIKIYSTIDQKCVKSWTTPPNIVFAGPAVHRLGSGMNDNNDFDYTYATINSGPDIPKEQERRVVWMWKDTRDDNSTKDSRVVKTFDKPIYSIHAPSSLRSHVILVNENGSLSLSKVELDRTVFKRTAHGNSCKVIWSTVFTYQREVASFIPASLIPGNSTVVATFCQSTEETNRYTINFYYISKEEDSIQPLVYIDFNSKNYPVSITFDPVKGTFGILDESGCLSIWKLSLTQKTKKTLGHLELQCNRELRGFQIVSKDLGPVAAIARLSKGYVALVAPRLKQDGDKVEHVLSVWDELYGTLQAERLIEIGNAGGFRKDECAYTLSILHNSHIVISVSSVQLKAGKKGKNTKNSAETKSVVVSCSFFQENVSLLSAMGGMRRTAKFLGLQNSKKNDVLGVMRCGLDIPCKPNEDNTFTDFEDLVNRRKEAEDIDAEARQRLLDPKLDVETFTNRFFEIAQYTPDQCVRPRAESLDSAMIYYSEKITFMEEKGSIDHLSSHLIHDITQKCFEDPNFWPEDVVLYLLGKERLWNRNVPGSVITQLLERNQWVLIRLALVYVPDISELDLVRLLKAIIAAQETEDKTSWKPSLKEYLIIIINSKHAGVFFGQALRRLTSSELPVVLNVVTELVESGASVSEIDENNFKSVLKFADALVDGHFPTLIMDSDLHKTVAKLRELLTEEIDVENEIQGALPALLPFFRKNIAMRKDFAKDQLKNKFKVKNQPQGIPPYRIEVIDWGFSV